ncbi:flagellar basal body rod protein FlgG [Viridibacillus arvi]|uniref:flagellar basal body rod protein FlgG n=1 Tax=Viridibacillus arvi TaxID=263475 RepID=UPI0034CDF0FB
MLRSMYSGISGLKNFQTKLDVIGNNIANVNTYGFKKGRVVFKDVFSQTSAGASAPTTTTGGTNPKQIGLGAQIAAIDTMHEGGSLQTTNRVLDLAVSGDGFFVVAEKATTPATGFINQQYTRAGNFYMDKNGDLVNSDGKYLYGVNNPLNAATPPVPATPADQWKAPAGWTGATPPAGVTPGVINIPTDAQSMSIGKDGVVNYVDKDGKLQVAGQLILAKFPNTGGLEKQGSNYYKETSNSGVANYNIGTQGGIGEVASGTLEMSNVDLSEEFTDMIVAQRGFQANTRIITTSDEILQELVNLKR